MTEFDLAQFLPYRLAVLAERVSRRLSVEYESVHGLSVAEWRVLVHLSRFDSVSVRDIQVFVNLEKSRVSRAVARLSGIGLVRKLPGTDDARLVEISLTPKGAAALDQILPRALAVQEALLQGIAPEDLSTFSRVMEQIHAVLDADPDARPRPTPGRTEIR